MPDRHALLVRLIGHVQYGNDGACVEQHIAPDGQASLPPVALADHPRIGVGPKRAGI